MQNIPPFIFYEKRTLCDPLVSLAFEAVGGFHDAALDDCSLFNGGVKIRFWEPYFYDQRQYNQFGVKGAEVTIAFDPQPNSTVLMLIYGLSDRSVFNFVPNLVEAKLTVNATDAYDLAFGFSPTRSTFEWIFQPFDG